MSRVAKNPIKIPENVDLSINENVVIVKGSKGELDFVLPDTISLEVADKVITIKYDEENQQSVALAGTSRTLINNMVIGVSEGFEKKTHVVRRDACFNSAVMVVFPKETLHMWIALWDLGAAQWATPN